MFFLFFPIKPSNKNSNPDYNNTNEKRKKKLRSNTNTDLNHNNTNEKRKKEKKETEIKKFLHVLQLVLPKSNPASKNSNPSQEHQRKEKTNYHLSLFIDEPEFSHSFPTRTTLSILRPKQHDHSKSRSILMVSRPKQHDPQDKLQQNLARPKQNDRFEEERRCKIHPCPPKPQATTPKSP